MAVNDDSWTGEVSGVLLCSCCNGMATAEWECNNLQARRSFPRSPRGSALPLVRTRVHTYSLHIVCQYTAQIKLNLKTEEHYFLTQLTNTFTTLFKKSKIDLCIFPRRKKASRPFRSFENASEFN